jgi:heme-degrading monooxygenase HmoA
METKVLTAVAADVPADREAEFIDGFRAMSETAKPEGLLRTELLRGQNGRWIIQTLWRDRAALMAARDPNAPPPALALLDQVGASHSHDVFLVEEQYDAQVPFST